MSDTTYRLTAEILDELRVMLGRALVEKILYANESPYDIVAAAKAIRDSQDAAHLLSILGFPGEPEPEHSIEFALGYPSVRRLLQEVRDEYENAADYDRDNCTAEEAARHRAVAERAARVLDALPAETAMEIGRQK